MNLEFRILKSEDSEFLSLFFKEMINNGDNKYFNPHGFSKEDAINICNYDGLDVYYAAFRGAEIIGYGILRGWAEGYQTPSLGIAIGKSARGLGLGRTMMCFLHSAAKVRGAKKIRLTVYKENAIAKKLYESLGYTFEDKYEDSLLGILEL